jgi:hypothetical protein
MVDKPNSVYSASKIDEATFLHIDPSTLTIETPDVEEIAKAIWQRQHDALPPDAISNNANWRDPSIPERFWYEFLLDAHAVLGLLYEKQAKNLKRGRKFFSKREFKKINRSPR